MVLRHRVVRFCIQLLFFIFAPGLFSAAFNGVKYLFAQIGATSAIEITSFVSLLLVLCVFTMVFGRFFCGFACSFGALGDVVYALFSPIRKALHLPDRPIKGACEKVARLFKYFILLTVCVLSFMQLSSSITPYDPWVAFASIISGQFADISLAALIIFLLIVYGMALQERFFCEFLCPLGALFALLPHLSVFSFARNSRYCPSACGRCQKNCPVGIFPDPDSLTAGECISCGKCADKCPLTNIGYARLESFALEGVLNSSTSEANLKISSSKQGASSGKQEISPQKVRKKKVKPAKVRGSELALVFAKVTILGALCFVLGQLRYVPW